MTTNKDSLREAIGKKLKWWRKQELKEIYYPLDEIMQLVTSHIEEAERKDSVILGDVLLKNHPTGLLKSIDDGIMSTELDKEIIMTLPLAPKTEQTLTIHGTVWIPKTKAKQLITEARIDELKSAQIEKFATVCSCQAKIAHRRNQEGKVIVMTKEERLEQLNSKKGK